jgi:hypothetical protein
MKKVLVALMMGCGLLVLGAGCGKEDAKGGDGKTGAAASGDKIGVQECDDYVTKYEACMSKVPAAAKPAMEQAFKAQRDGFKQAASTPEGKAALKTSCKQALDALAQNPSCK